MGHHIFISYSRKDKVIVNKVVTVIKQAGFTVWIDTSGIESGEQFKHKIVNAIEQCDVLLFFSSKNSNKSPWTAKEIGVATSLQKRIIPIKIDNSPFNKDVLFDLVNVNYIDLTNKRNRGNNLQNLLSSLNNICPKYNQTNDVTTRNENMMLRFLSFLKNSFINNNVLRIKLFKNSLIEFKNLPYKDKWVSIKKLLKTKMFWAFSVISLVLSISVIGIYRVKLYIKYACTTERKIIDKALPGNILAHDGRILATYEPKYDIYIDCSVIPQMELLSESSAVEKFRASRRAHKLYKEFSDSITPSKAYQLALRYDNLEDMVNFQKDTLQVWKNNEYWCDEARRLSFELSNLLLDKSPEEYYSALINGRRNMRRYVPICKNVEKVICDSISRMPLLRNGQFRGGLIVKERNNRVYPYGNMARRILGYNIPNVQYNGKIGIEGTLDTILTGIDGEKTYQRINFKGKIKDNIINNTPKVNGADVRTTLSIHMQQQVDHVLREYLYMDTTIVGGTVVVVDVQSGAIRAMSNIMRTNETDKQSVGELFNLAIGYTFEPGTILGGATLASFLHKMDRHGMAVSVNDVLDSLDAFNIGINRVLSVKPYPSYGVNDYSFVRTLINTSNCKDITARDGVSQSNPYVLAGLACAYHGELESYIDILSDLQLTNDLGFEIKCEGRPILSKPKYSDNYNNYLISLGCGYGIRMTPLQIITFYNMIANRGVPVLPYIIESYDNGNELKYKHQIKECPPIIDFSIVSQLDSVMRFAVDSGYSGITGLAKEKISGLSGYAFHYHTKNGYVMDDGSSCWDSSFVGYFPYDNPKYSVICTIITSNTKHQYPGNGIPAQIVSDIYSAL